MDAPLQEEPNPLCALAPLYILVVDDDPLIASIAADHFAALGLRVTCVDNGVDALREMEAELPDLVLCDRKMPQMSGAELLEEIRRRGPEWQSVVFVFVTSLVDRRDRYAMMPLHPDGYLCKPIDFVKDDLLIASILQAKRQSTTRTAVSAP